MAGWNPRDFYTTREALTAWQQGYNALEAYRGANAPSARVWLEDVARGLDEGMIVLHPTTVERLREHYSALPEHLHDPLFDGFGTALVKSLSPS